MYYITRKMLISVKDFTFRGKWSIYIDRVYHLPMFLQESESLNFVVNWIFCDFEIPVIHVQYYSHDSFTEIEV